MTPETPPSERLVARAAVDAFGGRPGGHRYYDEDESHSVDIVKCDGTPSVELATYSTVSLHQYPNFLDDKDIRTEFAGVADSGVEQFSNALSTAAFFVIKDRWLAAPGVVFPGILNAYSLGTRMEHVLWYPPYPWEPLGSLSVNADLTVHWLLAVPIHESERQYLMEHGYFELENLFERKQVEYWNLRRSPVA